MPNQAIEINPNNIHISFSEFSQYKQCPHLHLIYKYLQLDAQPPSIHLIFGNALHEAIEKGDTHHLSTDARVKYFCDKFKKDMLDNMQDYEQFKEMDDFAFQGEQILRAFSFNDFFGEYETLSVEESLYESVHGRFHFKGFLDKTAKKKNENKYIVADYKSSGEPWDVGKKLKDEVFLGQMRFYKYFWARKNNVPLEDIECKYVVLNRLKNKKDKNSGFGGVQIVDVDSSEEEIYSSLGKLAEVMRKIHIENEFPKVKVYGDERRGCMFCKFKGGVHPLCNSKYNQYVELLKTYRKT